jgi:hypothetical protein
VPGWRRSCRDPVPADSWLYLVRAVHRAPAHAYTPRSHAAAGLCLALPSLPSPSLSINQARLGGGTTLPLSPSLDRVGLEARAAGAVSLPPLSCGGLRCDNGPWPHQAHAPHRRAFQQIGYPDATTCMGPAGAVPCARPMAMCPTPFLYVARPVVRGWGKDRERRTCGFRFHAVERHRCAPLRGRNHSGRLRPSADRRAVCSRLAARTLAIATLL